MLVRAHTADYAQQESLPLPLDFDELLSTVSEAFALQRGSVRIRSKHAPTDLWVVLASQSQLMDAVREASESAMHMLTIEVSGRSARRTLDALMFALDLARLGAQVAYLWWLSEEGLSLTLGPYTVSPAAALGVLLLLSVLANSIVALSVLVTELSENGALRRWFGGARGRIAPLLCSPLTLETLPLVASGVCGLDAPLRAATRDGIIQWASWACSSTTSSCSCSSSACMVCPAPRRSPHPPPCVSVRPPSTSLTCRAASSTSSSVPTESPSKRTSPSMARCRRCARRRRQASVARTRSGCRIASGRRRRRLCPCLRHRRGATVQPATTAAQLLAKKMAEKELDNPANLPGIDALGTRIHRSMSPGRRAVFTHRRPSSACMCVLRATPPPHPAPFPPPARPSSSVLPFLSPPRDTIPSRCAEASHAPSSRAPLPLPPPIPPSQNTPTLPSLTHTHTLSPSISPPSPPLLSPPPPR